MFYDPNFLLLGIFINKNRRKEGNKYTNLQDIRPAFFKYTEKMNRIQYLKPIQLPIK